MAFGALGMSESQCPPIWSVGCIPRCHSRARAGSQRPSRAGMSQSAATSQTALGPPGWLQPGSLLQEHGDGVRASHGMKGSWETLELLPVPKAPLGTMALKTWHSFPGNGTNPPEPRAHPAIHKFLFPPEAFPNSCSS